MGRNRARHPWLALVVFLALSYAVAGIGTLATIPNIPGWYARAAKPAWTPPDAVFGPVWTVLYALIAVAAWLVWRVGTPRRRPAMIAYGVQLGLNLVWTPVFFAGYPVLGIQALWAGLAIIIALDLAIIAQIVFSARCSRLAAWLLVPYLLWCLYATTLNAGVATHRFTDPFGNPGSAASWSSDRGFLEDPESTLTGLTQVGARLYDPGTGSFTTADPLLAADTADEVRAERSLPAAVGGGSG